MNDKEFMFFMEFSANNLEMAGCNRPDGSSGSNPDNAGLVPQVGVQNGFWSEVAT